MDICAIFDKKAQEYRFPMFVDSVVDAIRSFQQAVNTSGNLINQYPEDFALYKVGSFDKKNGKLMPDHVSVFVVEGLSCVAPVVNRADSSIRPVSQDSARSADVRTVGDTVSAERTAESNNNIPF